MEVDSSSYLGVEMDQGLTFTEFKARIGQSAKKPGSCVEHGNKAKLSIKASINLWESSVRPSLPKCGDSESGNPQKSFKETWVGKFSDATIRRQMQLFEESLGGQ